MKNDIDQLMEQKNIDAMLVVGSARHNSAMVYFTGVVHASDALLIKKRGESAVLIHNSMERDEAARSGLETKSFDDYELEKYLTEFDGNKTKALAHRMRDILDDFQVSGRVSLYGKSDVGVFYGLLNETRSILDAIEFVSETRFDSVLMQARITKDEEEVDRIRKVGEITVSTVEDVAGFLKSHKVKDGILVNRQDQVLTIGEVKRRINLWLTMRGVENPEGTVFAIGSDAGVPHSEGLDHQPVEIGKTIVFDIFPCEVGGGYFFDFTRTWCLGYAPDEVQKVYDDVLDVYNKVYEAIEPNRLCSDFQELTCDLFEAKGHPTIKSDRKTLTGYVHSLAHGIGLDVHEGPDFYKRETNKSILLPGSVITVEPGLYYPERGMGVRLEDTVWVRPDGTLETLVEYSKDLVLEIDHA
jgi:Xaa-Pro aminopeptidase